MGRQGVGAQPLHDVPRLRVVWRIRAPAHQDQPHGDATVTSVHGLFKNRGHGLRIHLGLRVDLANQGILLGPGAADVGQDEVDA